MFQWLDHSARRNCPASDNVLRKERQKVMAKKKIRLLDTVALLEDLPERKLKRGEVGTVVEILAPDIRSVHVKDANRPTANGHWGEEVPLGRGQVNIPEFVRTLQRVGYRGPLVIEREVGDQSARVRDVAHGIEYLRGCLAGK